MAFGLLIVKLCVRFIEKLEEGNEGQYLDEENRM